MKAYGTLRISPIFTNNSKLSALQSQWTVLEWYQQFYQFDLAGFHSTDW
jgi:hypothetical protein